MMLLQRMGWKAGEGLGKNKEGQKEPLMLDFKTDRRGSYLFVITCPIVIKYGSYPWRTFVLEQRWQSVLVFDVRLFSRVMAWVKKTITIIYFFLRALFLNN